MPDNLKIKREDKIMLFPMKIEMQRFNAGDKIEMNVNFLHTHKDAKSKEAVALLSPVQKKKYYQNLAKVSYRTFEERSKHYLNIPENPDFNQISEEGFISVDVKFKFDQLWLRWLPDEAFIPNIVGALATFEQDAFERMIKKIGDVRPSFEVLQLSENIEAWEFFCNEVGVERACHIIRNLATDEWKYDHERLIGKLVADVSDEEYPIHEDEIADPLLYFHYRGIDLNKHFPTKFYIYQKNRDELSSMWDEPIERNGNLVFSDNEDLCMWESDFFEACDMGLGTIIPSDKLDALGAFEWLMIFGVNEEDDTTVDDLIKRKIATGDFGIFPQDYPTNNSEESTTYSPFYKNGKEYLDLIRTSNFDDSDANRLGSAILQDSDLLQNIERVGSHDIKRFELLAKIMLKIGLDFFYPILDEFGFNYNHENDQSLINQLSKFLCPAGYLPTVRIGANPYSILPISEIKRGNLFNYLLDLANTEITRSENAFLTEGEIAKIINESRIPEYYNLYNLDSRESVRKFGELHSIILDYIKEVFINDAEERREINSYLKKFTEDLNGEAKKEIITRQILDLFMKRFDAWFLVDSNQRLASLSETKTRIGLYGIVESPGVEFAIPQVPNGLENTYSIGPSEIQASIVHLIRLTIIDEQDFDLPADLIRPALTYLEDQRKGSLHDEILGRYLETLIVEDPAISYQQLMIFKQKYSLSKNTDGASNVSDSDYDLNTLSFIKAQAENSDLISDHLDYLLEVVNCASEMIKIEMVYQIYKKNMSKAAACQEFIEGNNLPPKIEFIQVNRTGNYLQRSLNLLDVKPHEIGRTVEIESAHFVAPILADLYNQIGASFSDDQSTNSLAWIPFDDTCVSLSLMYGVEDLKIFSDFKADYTSSQTVEFQTEFKRFFNNPIGERVIKNETFQQLKTKFESVAKVLNQINLDNWFDRLSADNWLDLDAGESKELFSRSYRHLKIKSERLLELIIAYQSKVTIYRNSFKENLLPFLSLKEIISLINEEESLTVEMLINLSAFENLDIEVNEYIRSKDLDHVLDREDKLILNRHLKVYQERALEVANHIISNQLELLDCSFVFGYKEIISLLRTIESIDKLELRLEQLEGFNSKILNKVDQIRNIDNGDFNLIYPDGLKPIDIVTESQYKSALRSYFDLLDLVYDERVFKIPFLVLSESDKENSIIQNRKDYFHAVDRVPNFENQERESYYNLFQGTYAKVFSNVANCFDITSGLEYTIHALIDQREGIEFNQKLSLNLINNLDSLSIANSEYLVSIIPVHQWSDFVPDKNESIGLSFSHPSPEQEAPNTIILALSRESNNQNDLWPVEELAGRISDTLDLMKIRMITSETVLSDDKLGPYFPPIYLHHNF